MTPNADRHQPDADRRDAVAHESFTAVGLLRAHAAPATETP